MQFNRLEYRKISKILLETLRKMVKNVESWQLSICTRARSEKWKLKWDIEKIEFRHLTPTCKRINRNCEKNKHIASDSGSSRCSDSTNNTNQPTERWWRWRSSKNKTKRKQHKNLFLGKMFSLFFLASSFVSSRFVHEVFSSQRVDDKRTCIT